MFTEKTVIQRLSFFDFAQFPCLSAVVAVAVCYMANTRHHRLDLTHVSTVRWLPYYRSQAWPGKQQVLLRTRVWVFSSPCDSVNDWARSVRLGHTVQPVMACAPACHLPCWHNTHPARISPVRQRNSLQLYHSSSESWTSANKRQRKQLIVSWKVRKL